MVALLLFFILLLIIFSIPTVQTSVASKLTRSLKENKNVNLNIERVSLGYLGDVKLKRIYIEDHHQDSLIYAKEIRTSILSLPRLFGNSPAFGTTRIDGLILKMHRYKYDEKDNLGIFIDKLSTSSNGNKDPITLSFDDIEIINSRYSFVDEQNSMQNVLLLDNLSIFASDLTIEGSHISVNINSLSARERRGLEFDNLSTEFSYSPTEMQLKNLLLQTPQSLIKADIFFNYKLEDFSDFVNKVQVKANFRKTSVSSKDLDIFYQPFGNTELLQFKTQLTGTLNDFQLKNLELEGMDRSSVNGNFTVKGAFSKNGEDFKITGDFGNFTTNYYDLVNLLPGIFAGSLPQNLSRLGSVRASGNAYLTKYHLDANLDLTSQLGAATANLEMRNLNTSENTTYKGTISAKEFNIGRFIDKPSVGKISFNFDVDGKGFTRENLNTQLKGKISKLGYNNYVYRGIRLIGNLKNPVFNGNFIANDPNLKMEFNGLADLSKDINAYDFEASVGYANLNALNFVKRDSLSIFKGDVIMNMKGTTIDNAFGKISLYNTSYRNQNDMYYFDDFSVTSKFNDNIRTININSPDVISGEMKGDFKLSEIKSLFENSLGSIYTNYRPSTITSNQFMEFNFNIYNKIVEVFYPEITVAPKTYLRGRVESDESEFKLTFNSPKIDAFKNMFQNVNLQVDNTNAIYNTYFEADSVSTPLYNFSEFSFINVTQRDTLFIRSEFRGGKKNNDVFNLNLFHTINKDNKSVVGIQKSDIKFKNDVWYINEEKNRNNKVVFDNTFNDFKIDSLVMSHANQHIRLSGVLRDSTYKNFSMQFENVDINQITPAIDSLQFAGTLNGKLDLLQEKGAYYPNTSLKIDSLKVNRQLLGNLNVKVEGNKDLTNYSIDATIKKKDFESLSALGNIDLTSNQPRINLEVDLQKLNLAAFSPLGGEVLSNMRGLASGEAKISGNYKNPDFSGALHLTNAGLKIPYLNVDLDFENGAEIGLNKQQFNFNNIGISDTKYKTTGILSGTISHKNFQKWFIDLGITTNRLLVLDTDKDEDALYYGTAFISGDASLKGPTDELEINVNATTEKGTVFKIPLSDTESVGDNSYIHFLSPEEKKARKAGEKIEIPEVKGLELVFDLDVTNDAEVEVVVDKKSGSTLRGRGAGNLLLEINTNGKFNMWGDFVVYEGVYNFKYAGLVQKTFKVESGGSINWDGNPTQAQLDVSAVYELDANPAVLLENPSINRKIPVNVVINLQGQLMQPDINFDINFPNASSVVRSELEYRMNDRASKELQALFLVTQGSFYSEFGLRQTAITGTLAERASSIVNDIFADEEGKFQVGVNYTAGDSTPDQQTVDRFGLTLSTQISDRVLINGQVGVPIGGTTESVIIGDLEIDFLLNEDGSLRAKVFNRENNIQFIGEEIGFTQGVGLSYSVDFDTFKGLLRKIMNKELNKTENSAKEKEASTEKTSMAPDYINFNTAKQN